MEFDCSFGLTFVILCFGLQLNFVEIKAYPVSNYGGYSSETYYIEAKVIRPQQGGSSRTRGPARPSYNPPWLTGQEESSSEERLPGFNIRIRSGVGIQRPENHNPIIFPSEEPQPQIPYRHRPSSISERNIPQSVWTTRDGKPHQTDSVSVDDVKKYAKNVSSPQVPEAFTLIKNDKENDNTEELFGDFFKWVGNNKKGSNMKSQSEQESDRKSNCKDKLGLTTLSKPSKSEHLSSEDIATKTNFVLGNENVDPDNEETSLEGLDVTEQSLLNALNDKSCPMGYKRVNGECKPKIKV